jgi:HAD superfamily hydrolase (TIGR01509 family)
MIKGIFFDAAGVLYKRSSPTADFALELLKNANFAQSVSDEENENLAKMRQDASMGQTSHESYWHHFLLFHGVNNLQERKEMIQKIVDFSNDVLPVPGCRETLSELKARGYVLGIISDTIYPLEWKLTRLAKAGVADLIEIIACSTDLGMHKPDPTFYRYAVNQANLTSAETAFVGHDIKELRGARRAGMMTVAVNYDPGAKADHYCQTISEMLQIPDFALLSAALER